ncbi:hypothetical protein [Levilactobacillus cerevisiae]|nr:hypothetical protein [Levilactobacillus cerevisiae]
MKLINTPHVKVSVRRTTSQEKREELLALIVIVAVVWLWFSWKM